MDEAKLGELRRFLEERPELGIASVYLFGSHAEGRAHRESDVDLGVLARWDRHPTPRDRFELRVQLGSDLIPVLGQNEVDVVILNDAPALLGRRIVYEGKRIFLGDPAVDHAFIRDVQLQAADLQPFLERMNRIRLEALTRSIPS